MTIPRWTPRAETTKSEERRLKSLGKTRARPGKTRKLLVFLRMHRSELFNEAFQAELSSMYRDPGEGMAPVPPALLAMTVLLQGYEGLGDARAIERTWSDKGWQTVLDLPDSDEPAFAQGTLSAFRERLISSTPALARRVLCEASARRPPRGGDEPCTSPQTSRSNKSCARRRELKPGAAACVAASPSNAVGVQPAVVSVGQLFEPESLAVSGTSLERFLTLRTAYYSLVLDPPSAALDELGLPIELRTAKPDDRTWAEIQAWADPALAGDHYCLDTTTAGPNPGRNLLFRFRQLAAISNAEKNG